MDAGETLIALDVGQTGVRALLRGPDVDRRASATGMAEPLAGPGAPERVAARVVGIVRELGPAGIDSLGIGLSGLDTAGDDAHRVARAIRVATDARRVTVASDVVAWHLAVFGGRGGVVAAVGTGSVALAADGSGRWARSDGWGHLLGDEASGFGVGRAGLASALRALDGRGGSERLLDLATRRFGGGSTIAATVYGSVSPAATIASFAPDVATAADGGDDEARRIWEDAGRALGRTLLGAWRRTFHGGDAVRTCIVGSLVGAGERLLGPCALEIAAHGLTLETVAADPLDGAALLGAGLVAPYPGLVVVEAA